MCYKIYESTKHEKSQTGAWKELEDGAIKILISNLWQFKRYTIEISIKINIQMLMIDHVLKVDMKLHPIK